MALLVNKASSYDCNIYIKLDNKTINAKSIMGVMSLIIDDGDEVVIITDGTDEEEAAMGIKSFLRSM
jgi:phosphotransferase system HPr (HPr) family protein